MTNINVCFKKIVTHLLYSSKCDSFFETDVNKNQRLDLWISYPPLISYLANQIFFTETTKYTLWH